MAWGKKQDDVDKIIHQGGKKPTNRQVRKATADYEKNATRRESQDAKDARTKGGERQPSRLNKDNRRKK